MAESDDSTVLLGNLRSRSPIVREFLSEFLGTFLLVVSLFIYLMKFQQIQYYIIELYHLILCKRASNN